MAALAGAADDDLLLSDTQADFQKMADNRQVLAAYHSETDYIDEAFDPPLPDG